MIETTTSSGGVDVSVPTLILDLSDYVRINDLSSYPLNLSADPPLYFIDGNLSFDKSGVFTAISPLIYTNDSSGNFHMSIDTKGFQPAFGLTVPTTGQVQLFNSTLNAFQALAPGTGISLTPSSDGQYTTIAANPDLSGYATTKALASVTSSLASIQAVVGTQANLVL